MNTREDLCNLVSLGANDRGAAVGEFLVRIRQIRRKRKVYFESLSDKMLMKNFAGKRAAWRLRRRPSCRHGVLFTALPENGCKCMSLDSCEADWREARFMPALDHELKCLIAVPFSMPAFKRLSILQAEARRLDW